MAERLLNVAEKKKMQDQGLSSEGLMIDENGDLFEYDEPGTGGLVARQGGKSIAPGLAGRYLGVKGPQLVASLLGFTPQGRVAKIAATVIPAIIGAMGTSAIQEGALNSLARHIPAVDEFQQASELDRQARPYASLAAQSLTAPLQGGGLMTNPLKSGLKNLVLQGGITSAIDVPSQLYAKGTEGFDPYETLLSGVLGAATATPNKGWRAKERSALQRFGASPEFTEDFAPLMAADSSAITPDVLAQLQRQQSSLPIINRPDYNPEALLNASPEQLMAFNGNLEKTIAKLKTQSVKLSLDDINTLASTGDQRGWNIVADEIRSRQLPDAVALEQQNREQGGQEVDRLMAEAEALSRANVDNTEELARQSAMRDLVGGNQPTKSAQDSAEFIQSQQPQQSKQASAAMANLQGQENIIKRMMAQLETMTANGDPQAPVLYSQIVKAVENLEIQRGEVLQRAGEVMGPPDEPVQPMRGMRLLKPGQGGETGAVINPREILEHFYNVASHLLKKKEWSGMDPKVKVMGGQIAGRLRNTLVPDEFEGLQEAGLEKFLLQPRTPTEVAQWIDENGPKMEVKEIFGNVDVNESASAKSKFVNPKPWEDMKGQVDMVGRVPFVKDQPRLTDRQWIRRESIRQGMTEAEVRESIELNEISRERRSTKFSTPYFGESGKNAFWHMRANEEPSPSGGKMLHVYEVQPNKEAQGKTSLYDQANRLALKAAIKYAREHGYDGIAISDSKTVGLTEGHDKIIKIATDVNGQRYAPDGSDAMRNFQHMVKDVKALRSGADIEGNLPGGGKFHTENRVIVIDKLPFLAGNEVNYDQILPKLAGELTGERGVEINLGEHQNILSSIGGRREDGTPYKYRDDLYYTNPDGTPKTSITARYYPIAKSRKTFSLYGSDKPLAGDVSAPVTKPVTQGNDPRMMGLPPKMMDNLKDSLHRKIRPVLTRVSQLGSIGKRMAKKAEQAFLEKEFTSAPLIQHMNNAQSGLSPQDQQDIHNYLYELKHTGSSDLKLSPELLKRAEMIEQVSAWMGKDAMENGPLVMDFDAEGKLSPRPRILKPNHVHEKIDPKIWDVLSKSKDPAKIQAIKDEYATYLMQQGAFPDRPQAMQYVNSRLKAQTIQDRPNPMFQKLRLAEGYGYPPSMRQNVFDAMRAEIMEHSTDMAFHRNFERDPAVGRAMGLKEDGRGTPYPPVVLDDSGTPISEGVFASNQDVLAMMQDFSGNRTQGMQTVNSIQGLFHSLVIGPKSQIRDLVGFANVLGEFGGAEGVKHLPKALAQMFNSEAYNTARQAGALRAQGNSVPYIQADAMQGINKLGQIIRTFTGIEAISAANRVLIYETLLPVARYKIAKGDTEMLSKWGPANWQTMDKEKLASYMAARGTRNATGTYNSEDLAAWNLPHSPNPLNLFAAIQRWGLGRANRYYDNVIVPAKKGNLVPLITTLVGTAMSTAGINWISEQISGRKPRELTMEEYLKLGGKDTAYTLASKAAAVGYAGILSDMAFTAVQNATGETPHGFNNLTLQSMDNFKNRVVQAMDDLQSGRAEWNISDLATYAFEYARDTTQILQMVTPREDVRGLREDRLARRVGFLPNQGRTPAIQSSSPLATEKLYDKEDSTRLRRVLAEQDRKTGKIDKPNKVSRTTPAYMVMSTNGPVSGYYEFIKRAQGQEAVTSAFNRDQLRDLKRKQTFERARTGN